MAANGNREGSIMLVLTRKVGESIIISDSIRVTVVQSSNSGRIRLGIEAPPEVIVLREELTNFCSSELPGKNGNAEARPPSA
jgi:carbon storage regulator